MLGGSVEDGDRVRVRWSSDDQKIAFEKLETEEPEKADAPEEEAKPDDIPSKNAEKDNADAKPDGPTAAPAK